MRENAAQVLFEHTSSLEILFVVMYGEDLKLVGKKWFTE